MRFLSSTGRAFIAGIFLTASAVSGGCGGTSQNKAKLRIPPGFDIVKGSTSANGGWASEIRHVSTGIEMVYVTPGGFMMGSPSSEKGRKHNETRHEVYLSRGYYIGKYEVTQWQWEKAMGNNPSKFKGANLPVDQVSWEDCQSFCKKIGSGFRLPTEAEWEYAARGGNRSKGFTYSGSDNLDEVGWDDQNSGKKTHEAGQKKANELGIYDMSGNVWEWCSDWHGEYYGGEVTNPAGTSTGSIRVLRGGSCCSYVRHCRAANRDYDLPSLANSYYGFRLALSNGQ